MAVLGDCYAMFAVYAPFDHGYYGKALVFHGLYHTKLDADHTIARYPNAFAVRLLFDSAFGYHVYCCQAGHQTQLGLYYFTNDIDEVLRVSGNMYPGCAGTLPRPTPVRTGYDEMAPEEVALREKEHEASLGLYQQERNWKGLAEEEMRDKAVVAKRAQEGDGVKTTLVLGNITIILDYSSTSHAFFGNTKVIKEELLHYNRDNTHSPRSSSTPLFGYNPKLKLDGIVTPGWIIRDKDRLNEAKALFDELGIVYSERTQSETKPGASAWKKPRSEDDILRTPQRSEKDILRALPQKELIKVFLTGQMPDPPLPDYAAAWKKPRSTSDTYGLFLERN